MPILKLKTNISCTKKAGAEEVGETTGHNILLVDDEKSIVLLLTEVLKSKNYHVTSFTDSESALSDFKENSTKYDAVITDQSMPNLTGVEMAKSMLEIQPDISIILCSGYSDTLDEESAKSIGIKSYLFKPVRNADILEEIAKILSKS